MVDSVIEPVGEAGARGKRRRLVVAMSGGVDSSVAAALLHRAGHEVIGITLQLYDHGLATARKGSCCAGQDIHDARRVADAIGIPHYVLDYERRFASTVMQAFADSYLTGETPIPCVTCNSQIKFRDLLETARELGAEALATGHYVQKIDAASGPMLARAVDSDRDQSYFLYSTTRAQLAALMFPLGGMHKPKIRELARAWALPVADKPDSQDICFVPTGRYSDVIERLKPGATTRGEIVHVDGRKLGEHDGIINFTVGQRRGLGVANGEPLYVLRLDAESNTVVVGARHHLSVGRLYLRDVNWLGDGEVEALTSHAGESEGFHVYVRMRSSQAPRPATLRLRRDGSAIVDLGHDEEGIAAGQACVFYQSLDACARVLGGGTIARAVSRHDAAAAGQSHVA